MLSSLCTWCRLLRGGLPEASVCGRWNLGGPRRRMLPSLCQRRLVYRLRFMVCLTMEIHKILTYNYVVIVVTVLLNHWHLSLNHDWSIMLVNNQCWPVLQCANVAVHSATDAMSTRKQEKHSAILTVSWIMEAVRLIRSVASCQCNVCVHHVPQQCSARVCTLMP